MSARYERDQLRLRLLEPTSRVMSLALASCKLACCPWMKYSFCLYLTGAETLAEAEIAMLELYVDRTELSNGMSALDLGCGSHNISIPT